MRQIMSFTVNNALGNEGHRTGFFERLRIKKTFLTEMAETKIYSEIEY